MDIPRIAINPDGTLAVLAPSPEIQYLRSLQNQNSYEAVIRTAYQFVVADPANSDQFKQELANNAPSYRTGAGENKPNLSFYPYFAAAIVKRALCPNLGNQSSFFLNAEIKRAASQTSLFAFVQEARTRNILGSEGFEGGALREKWNDNNSFFRLLSNDFVNYGPLVIDLRWTFDHRLPAYSSLPNRTSYSVDGAFGIIVGIDSDSKRISIFLPLGRSINGINGINRINRMQVYVADELANSARAHRLPADKPFWFRYTGVLPI